jgi:prolyl 4-hydroxylase
MTRVWTLALAVLAVLAVLALAKTDSTHDPTPDSTHDPTPDAQYIPTPDAQYIPTPDAQYADASVVCKGVYVAEIPDFLTSKQCDALVAAANKRTLIQSEINGSHPIDLTIRDSKQTWFDPGDHPCVDAIQAKTHALLAAMPECLVGKYDLERVQVAKYEPGGKYNAHYDADPCDGECPHSQRFATLMVYLAEPLEGGDTHFPLLNRRVTPQKGKAVFFWVADPRSRDVFEKSLHAGLPVLAGTKWIANQWILTG